MKTRMQTILGVDWGQRRVGLSIGNTVAKRASPLPAVDAGEAFAKLQEHIVASKVSLVVIGLPRSLEGLETAQTRTVRNVADNLRIALQCELAFQDETLSSEEAIKLSAEYPDADIDSLAATVILQDYLNKI